MDNRTITIYGNKSDEDVVSFALSLSLSENILLYCPHLFLDWGWPRVTQIDLGKQNHRQGETTVIEHINI